MKHWTHGHSLAVGSLFGATLMVTHLWLLLTLTFAAGVVVGRMWRFALMLEDAIRMKLTRAKREHISTKPVPVYEGRLDTYGEVPF